MTEQVRHPAHYGGDNPHETIKVLRAWMSPSEFIGFCRGNAIKYLSRAGKKGSATVDCDKAAVYSEWAARAEAERMTNKSLVALLAMCDSQEKMLAALEKHR